MLEIRFGLAASDPLAARLAAIDDVQRLKQLFRAAIQVPSLEAFRHLLDKASSTLRNVSYEVADAVGAEVIRHSIR